MNITETFRRKNLYHKPILVFKELYRDYYKQSSPFKYRNPNLTLTLNEAKSDFKKYQNTLNLKQSRPASKLKKTRSAQQFSEYLMKYATNQSQNTIETIQSSIRPKTLSRKLSKTKNKTMFVKSLDRTLLQCTNYHNIENQINPRSYLKDTYTQSHPFFQKTKNLIKQKNIDQKQNQTQPILPEIFKQTDATVKKPLQKRIQMQDLKNKFINRKQKAVQKFSKIRHNFLVMKNYRQEQPQSRPCSKDCRIRNSFQTTKQNIFPESFL